MCGTLGSGSEANNERPPVKMLPVLGIALIAFTTAADPSSEDSLETITARRVKEAPPLFNPDKPNEIKAGRLTYSGVAVEVAKITEDPLHLINPFAPSSFGQADSNVAWDPITGRASGIRLFSIQF
jgi:hypothetical protein